MLLYYRILLLFLLTIAFPANSWLPVEWGWENNVLEWLQVLILAIGLILSWRMGGSSFGLVTTPVWLVMIGRELSWGRVFFPLGIGQAGPYFPALKELWYGPAVYPTVTVILLVWIFAIFKYKLYIVPLEMIKQRIFPWTNLFLIILSAIVAYIGEKHMHLPITEEFAEAVAYVGLVVWTLQFNNIINTHRFIGSNKITYKNSI